MSSLFTSSSRDLCSSLGRTLSERVNNLYRYKVVPQIAENVTNDLIEANLKPCIVNTVIEDHDAFRSEVPTFISKELKVHALAIIEELFKNHVQSNVIHVHPTITTSTETESSANLQYQLYLKMKRNLQDRADDITLEDDFHSHHDEHQDDDAPLEGEKRVKRRKMSKRSKSARDSSSKHSRKDSTTYVQKEFKTFNEDARLSIQHWKDSWHKNVYKQNQKKVRKNPEDYYSNYKITEVVRIVTDQPHGLDFMKQILVIRANDKPNNFSKADFMYLNKNDIEDLYYLCRSKEIDNLKVNLTTPTLTFPGIEEHAPYTIVDEPQIGLIYLNSKDEKRVMYLEEIVKFCDATLENVLNEVKLIMFESKFLKKPPLLGELDQGIMKAYEREISKRLSHGQQMRRWESFVIGRPILPMMKRL
ncbi:hypothetical protein Tco_0793066 [Tanacetum coccineum]